jgi:prepilin-type N-terminal cleavage/methylation domain-containing protein
MKLSTTKFKKDNMKIISALKNLKNRTAGFTMIELLIVIAILGILAVAVLAAINPIEQINRGRDTGSRSDAEQLLSAIERYNAFQGVYPWQSAPDPATVDITPPILVSSTWMHPITGFTLCPILDLLGDEDVPAGCPLTNTNELKSSFMNRINATNYNDLYIYNSGLTGASTYVCFDPQSSAFEQEALTRCGTNATGLPADIVGTIRQQICNVGGAIVAAAPSQNSPMICLP